MREAIQAAVAARGGTKGTARPSRITPPGWACWEGLPPGALAAESPELVAAFPQLRFRFQGEAAFTAGPQGYLQEMSPPSGFPPGTLCLGVHSSPLPGVALLGNRIRHRIPTFQEDAGGGQARIGWPAEGVVGSCGELRALWRRLDPALLREEQQQRRRRG